MRKTTVSKAYEKFKPESCVMVLSVDKKEVANGMTCSWHMKCSEDPPLFAVALWKQGNTQKLIRESKEFVIAVGNKNIEKELAFFGATSGKEINKFSKTKIKTTKSKHIKTPLLTDATINFECRLYKIVDTGECYLFIGKILESYVNEKEKILFDFKNNNGKRYFKEL